MRKIIGIAAGGMAGALLRYWIRSVDVSGIPWDTLAVNVVGSFLLALILTLALDKTKLAADVQAGMTVGFLGAFTTFSAICQENVTLFRNGQGWLALLYMTITVALGIAATYAGWRLARRLRPQKEPKTAAEEDEG